MSHNCTKVQVKGIHYTETFSAAAKMPTIYVVLANVAHQDWEIEHIDIKSLYLNIPLKEKIYIKPLCSILKPSQEGKVLRLLKGLYGLKQVGRGYLMAVTSKRNIDTVKFKSKIKQHWEITDHGPI